MPDAGAPLGGALLAAPVIVGAILALGGAWVLLRGPGVVRHGPIAALVVGAVLVVSPRLLPGPEVASRAAPDASGAVAPALAPPAPTAPPVLGEGVAVAIGEGRTVAAPLAAKPPSLPGRPATVIAIEASEAEPNDTLASANRAALGVAIVGDVGPGESDWFAFDVPAGTGGTLVANLTVGDASAALGLYDDAGQTLGIATTYDALALRKVTLERRPDAPRYYVVVRGGDAATDYHLTVAIRR